MATWGLSVNRPNDRSGFLSSAERPRRGDALAVFERRLHELDDLELLGQDLPVGPRLLHAGLETLDAIGDGPEVGEEHLFPERGQLGRGVAADEPIQDDEERVAFADQGQALGIVRVRAGHQSGRIEELHRGRGDFLGLMQRREVIQSRIGQHRDAELARVNLARIGACPGQELK